MFSFDTPPDGTELEGAPSAGDSGGPALLRVGGKSYVAGISSAGFNGRSGPASYGAIDVYTRVSTHVAWADSVMKGAIAPRVANRARDEALSRTPQGDSVGVALPATPAGARMRAFVTAMHAGSDSALLRFLGDNFARSELASRPADQRLPNFRRLSALLRTARVLEVVESGPSSIVANLSMTDGGTFVLELLIQEGAPHGILDWRRRD